jgi:hypothetical protein
VVPTPVLPGGKSVFFPLIKREKLINYWFVALLAAVAVAASLGGCGGSGASTPGSSSASAEASASEAARPTTTQTTSSSSFRRKKPPLRVPGHKSIPVVVVRPSLTKANYLAQANAKCKESIAQMSESVKRSGTVSFAEKSQRIYLPGMQFWFDDIHYLGTPAGDAGQIEAMLQALQLAVWRGEEQGVSSAARLSALFNTFSRRARRYGLDACIVRPGSLPS